MSRPPVYGLLGTFDRPERLLDAIMAARARGYRRLDAFLPGDMEPVTEALGNRHTGVPLLTLAGGIAGGLAGYGLQYYSAVISYPLDVGGRPEHSWPMFVPVTFESTVLGAALAAFFGMLFLNGLPRLDHPLFAVPGFGMSRDDRFFLCLESADPAFDAAGGRELMERAGALAVHEVPW